MAAIPGSVNPCRKRVLSPARKHHAALAHQFDGGQDGDGRLLIGWGFDDSGGEFLNSQTSSRRRHC